MEHDVLDIGKAEPESAWYDSFWREGQACVAFLHEFFNPWAMELLAFEKTKSNKA